MTPSRPPRPFLLSTCLFVSILAVSLVTPAMAHAQGAIEGSDPTCTWTPWLDRDNPSGSGDFENLSAFVDSGQACAAPRGIECRTRLRQVDWTETGQTYTCQPDRGGICVNSEQGGELCLDYEIRVCCTPNEFRDRAERLAPLLERAAAGEEPGPFSRNELLRQMRFWSSRVGPDGDYAAYPEALFAQAEQTAARVPQLCDTCLTRTDWSYLGPSDLETQNQGVVRAIWVSPGDPDLILIGAGSGLWRTDDGGKNWRNLTAGSRHLRLVGVHDIAVNPRNQDEILVGTGLAFAFADMEHSYGFGVFRSTDGGRTWNATMGNLEAKGFPGSRRVLYHPTRPGIAYASLGHELHRSADGGATWTRLFEAFGGDHALEIRDLALDVTSSSSDALYVATASARHGYDCSPDDPLPWTFEWGTTSGDYCELKHTARVWKLDVAGSGALSTTTDLTEEIDTEVADGYDPSTILTAVEVVGGRVLVAGQSGLLGEIGTGQVVFYEQQGATWTKTLTGGTHHRLNYGHSLEFAVSQADPDVVYLGGHLLMKSQDGGKTFDTSQNYWDFVSDPRWRGSHPDVRALFLRGQGPQGDVVYFGTDGGLSRTVDGLQSTENLNGAGLHLAEIQGVGLSEDRPGLYVFGTQHNGFFTNREHRWEVYPFGDFYDVGLFDDGNGGHVALTTMNSTVIRESPDGRATLTSSQCPESTCADATLAVTDDGIYLGRTSVHRKGVPGCSAPVDGWCPVAQIPGCRVSALAPTGDGKTMYVGCAEPLWNGTPPFTGKAFRIDDLDTANPVFSDITAGFRGVAWKGITDAVTNDDGSVAYFALGGTQGAGVYRFANGSWTPVADGLPSSPVNALSFDEASGSLFAGTDMGVYLLTPKSDGWRLFGRTPFTLVSDLELDRTRRYLVAATFGHGLWGIQLPPAAKLANDCELGVTELDDDVFVEVEPDDPQ